MIKFKIIFWSKFLLFLMWIGFISCGLPKITNPAPMVNEVLEGSAFRVNLPENHTNGYIWQLNSDFDHSVLEEQNSVWHGDKKGIDFNFKALAVGQTTLHLIKRKYTDTAEVTSFVVKIVSN